VYDAAQAAVVVDAADEVVVVDAVDVVVVVDTADVVVVVDVVLDEVVPVATHRTSPIDKSHAASNEGFKASRSPTEMPKAVAIL
jgi:hypothetical protein